MGTVWHYANSNFCLIVGTYLTTTFVYKTYCVRGLQAADNAATASAGI